MIIFSFLSFVNQILLGRTCKRLHSLIRSSDFIKRAEEHLADVFVIPVERLFSDTFVSEFRRYFLNQYRDLHNVLYLKYFLSLCKDQLTSRLIFEHLYWCRRSSYKYSCKYCCPVKRCLILDENEDHMRYRYLLFHYSRWDEKIIKIFKDEAFFSDDFNLKYKSCYPIEIIYSYNQLMNFFGVIGVRIYFNIGKKHIFIRQFRQKHLYNCFLQFSRKLFSAIIESVKKHYVSNVVRLLRPVRDYDPTHLKITNTFYMRNIGKKWQGNYKKQLALDKEKQQKCT